MGRTVNGIPRWLHVLTQYPSQDTRQDTEDTLQTTKRYERTRKDSFFSNYHEKKEGKNVKGMEQEDVTKANNKTDGTNID